MKKGMAIALILLVAILAGLAMSAYTIKEHEQAVILAFGEVVGKPITEPGLHLKYPWYEARKFDKRWLAWDGDPNQITTLDKRYILIDVFARWRIIDPLVFIAKLRDEESAQGRLDDILDSATRNVIANHNLIEAIRSTNRSFKFSEEERENMLDQFSNTADDIPLPPPVAIPAIVADKAEQGKNGENPAENPAENPEVQADIGGVGATAEQKDMSGNEVAPVPPPVQPAEAPEPSVDPVAPISADQETGNSYTIINGRQKLTELIIEKAKDKARELGIELKDVRLKRIDYIESVQRSVFDRMVSERLKVAARLRSQGDGNSAEILGRKERDLKKIRSEAYKKAEEIKGRADATAARIYADAYKRDPDLYKFLKTLESYRETIGERTWLLITTESDYGSYFKSSN